MVARDPYGQWVQLWNAIRSPVSFGLGTVVIVTELVRYVTGGAVEPQLLIVGAGLCGLPAFLPPRSGSS